MDGHRKVELVGLVQLSLSTCARKMGDLGVVEEWIRINVLIKEAEHMPSWPQWCLGD